MVVSSSLFFFAAKSIILCLGKQERERAGRERDVCAFEERDLCAIERVVVCKNKISQTYLLMQEQKLI